MRKIRSRTLLLCGVLLLAAFTAWGQSAAVLMPKGISSAPGDKYNQNITDPVDFYDHGGAAGDFAPWQIARITFSPRPNERIKVEFITCDLGAAKIHLFHGRKSLTNNGDDDYPDYVVPSGADKILTGSEVVTFVSEKEDGKLTVCFENETGTAPGWVARVSSEPKAPVPPQPAPQPTTFPKNAIYTIGATPINFYDDGGQNGKISENFEGQVTFRPTTPNAKVKVEFTKVNLFYTTAAVGVGREDKLFVYNGEGAKTDNQLGQVTTEPRTFFSTTDDGALTITLKSVTGVPAEGFEAVVSEFTPEPMVYESTQVAAASAKSVAAGDVKQPLMWVNVRMANTHNPLSLTSLAIEQTGTPDAASRAVLYHHPNGKDKPGTEVAAADVASNLATLTLSAAQPLKVGDNFFLLAVDIKETLANDARVDARCKSVELSNGAQTIDAAGQASVARTVQNTHHSVKGHTTRKVYTPWQFSHTEGVPGKYVAQEANEITTFTPGQPNSMVQIDFSDFEVYYSKFGAKADFAIYNGLEANIAEKIWEVDGETSGTGPGRVIRSTHPTGALTIKFNANTNSTQSCRKGWHATVTSIERKPMEVQGVSVLADPPATLAPGNTRRPLFGFKVQTQHTEAPKVLEEMLLNLTEPQLISKVELYSMGGAQAFDPAKAKLLGSVETPAESAELTLAPTSALGMGDNYYWVTVDVAANAEQNKHLGFSLSSLKISGAQHAPAETHKGSVVVRNEYRMERGANTKALASGEVLYFYDDGGADQPFSTNFTGSVLFEPPAGHSIRMRIVEMEVAGPAPFRIYNGDFEDMDHNLLFHKLAAMPSQLEYVSTDESGKLKVKFSSTDVQYDWKGWCIEVTAVPQDPLVIAGVSASSVAATESIVGAEAIPMLKIAVRVNGVKGSVKLGSLAFSRTGTAANALAKARLVYSGLSDLPSGGEVEATLAEGDDAFTIAPSVAMTMQGMHYYWLLYDTKADAVAESPLSAKLTAVQGEGGSPISVEIAPNETATTTLKAATGLKGTYTIGQGESTTYKSFTKAIEDLVKQGVSGPVVFEVEAGDYAEVLGLKEVKGTTATNTITFRAKPNASVKIAHSEWKAVGEQGVDTDWHGVVTLRGADYVTFENIAFETTDPRYHSVVTLQHRSTHASFVGCRFKAPLSNFTEGHQTRHLALADTVAPGLQTNDYLRVERCAFTEGYIGIALSGAKSVTTPRERGVRIVGNTFTNVEKAAIYAFMQEDLVVEGNTIVSKQTEANEAMGIVAERLYGPATIAKNRITLTTGKENRGIELRTVIKGRADAPILVVNNEISITSIPTAKDTYGILLGTKSDHFASGHLHLLHNSVLVQGSDCSNCGAVKLYGTGDGTRIAQNLLQVTNPKGKVYGAYMLDVLKAGYTFLGNGAWAADKFATMGGSIYTAEKWMKATGANEPDMVNVQAQFVDEQVDLSLYNGAAFQTGTANTHVAEDITGKVRPSDKLTLGAREFVQPELAFAKGYPSVESKSKTTISYAVAASANGVTLYYKLQEASAEQPQKDAITDSRVIGRGKEVLTLNDLTSNTKYVLYVYLKGSDDRETEVMALPYVITDRETGDPLTFAEGKPSLLKSYGNAAVFTFEVSSNATVHYAIKRKGEVAPTQPQFDPQHTVQLEGQQPKQHPIEGLESSTEYVLYTYAQSEAGEETIIVQVPFATQELKTLKPSSFVDLAVDHEDPFASGTQRLEGFKAVKAAFPGVWGSTMAGQIKDLKATIDVETGRYPGELLKGFYVQNDKPFSIRLIDATGKESTVEIPTTESDWLYVPLESYGPVRRVELTRHAEGVVNVYTIGEEQKVLHELYMEAPAPVAANGSTVLSARLTGFAYPYTVKWTSLDGATEYGTSIKQSVTLGEKAQTFKLTVSDAKASNHATVTVRPGSDLQVATFEDLQLAENSVWKGEKRNAIEQFASGSFALPNWSSKFGWSGFAYSNSTAIEYDGNPEHDYRNRVGAGANGSKTWGVYFGGMSRFTLQVAPDGAELPGIWVTNNSYAWQSMAEGDAYAGGPFKEGDHFKVIFQANGKSVEYYLADYRSTDSKEHYIQDKWAWVDLSSLGKVSGVEITFDGTRKGIYGLNTPSYVCLDDIGSARPEKAVEAITVFSNSTETMRVSLATLAGMEESALHVEKEGDWTWSDGTAVDLDGATLTVAPWSGSAEASKEFVVKLSRRGVTQWLRIPVALRTAVPTYTFAGYSIAAGEGEVAITVEGTKLEKGQSVKATDNISVVATPGEGWRLPAAGAVQATGANPIEGGLWRASADNFAFTVRFEQIPPATFTLAAFDVVGRGELRILNAANEELALGAVLTAGDLLTIEAKPSENHELKPENLKTEGLEKTADGQYKVTGNVKVSATFTEKSDPQVVEEFTILALDVKGKGTMTLKRADGTVLKVNDKVGKDALLSLELTPSAGHELKPSNLTVSGLEKQGEGQWKVTADVRVEVKFTAKVTRPTDVASELFASVRIYPNPVEHTLHVEAAQAGLRYALYDALGGLRLQGVLSSPSVAVDAMHLPAGVYMLQLVSGDGSAKTFRVVKQ